MHIYICIYNRNFLNGHIKKLQLDLKFNTCCTQQHRYFTGFTFFCYYRPIIIPYETMEGKISHGLPNLGALKGKPLNSKAAWNLPSAWNTFSFNIEQRLICLSILFNSWTLFGFSRGREISFETVCSWTDTRRFIWGINLDKTVHSRSINLLQGNLM